MFEFFSLLTSLPSEIVTAYLRIALFNEILLQLWLILAPLSLNFRPISPRMLFDSNLQAYPSPTVKMGSVSSERKTFQN